MAVFQCFWIIITIKEIASCKRHKKDFVLLNAKQCKMTTFVHFKQVANEKCVVFLKQRQILIKARRKFYEEKIKWEEKKKDIQYH